MKSNRRNFIKSAGVIGAGFALSPEMTAKSRSQIQKNERSPKVAPMKILMLGGTGFIGPNMVQYAVDRGHEVSIFTRGNSKSETPGVEHLVGDRNNDLSALKGRKWDVVLDNNARDYRWVQLSTETLKNSCDHYVFVSSISAYNVPADENKPKNEPSWEPLINENSNRYQPEAGWKDGDDAPYGLTKALSENIAHKAFPGKTTIVRPGLIVGPGDRTDRWTYWPVRIADGGEVLAPGNPDHANQVIDQRDLTEWIVRLAENQTMGNFNGVGPANRMSMSQMLYGIWGGVGGDATFTWVEGSFLEQKEVQPWVEMPSWIPGDPLMFCTNKMSVDAGLTFRPLAVTAADTLEWDLARPKEDRENRRAGMKREREQEILKSWAKR